MDHHTDTPLVLKRRIHLTRLLGEGSMGQVFDGFASDLGQYLAVKVLRSEHANDSEIQTRFEEETSLLGLIDHPGSPLIYGKGKNSDGLPFYAMKKVEGKTLADLLAERGADVHNAPWRRRLLAILLDACETVAYAHETGIVHRDIKPRNILIDRHRSVYVIDWGIAKRLGSPVSSSDASLTSPGKVIGSPGYMAPEQAEGRADSVGPQADVFALGAVLYEILTGKRPFGGTGGIEEVLASVHREAKPPHHGNWTLPRGISRICMTALHKDPAQRYPDARGLAADLRAFLEGRLSWLERIREGIRQRPLRWVAIFLIALFPLIATVRFGAQVWTDHRMALRAMDRIAELDAELASIAAETEAVRTQLAELKTGEKKRLDRKEQPKTQGELEKELHKLNARWVLTEFEALRLLVSVVELRFVWVEPEVQPAAKKRLFQLIASLIERDQPALASALVDTKLARHLQGRSAFDFSADEIKELKKLGEEADKLFVAPKQP
jgi:predicted Ser/Thr protein kinase